MLEQLHVPIEVLRQASKALLDHLEAIEGASVALDIDHFWRIAPEQLFNVYNEPNDFTIGQLAECLESLAQIADDPARATSFALVWLADLLHAIGQTVVR